MLKIKPCFELIKTGKEGFHLEEKDGIPFFCTPQDLQGYNLKWRSFRKIRKFQPELFEPSVIYRGFNQRQMRLV